MTKLIHVKPAEGARIRQPNRNFRVMSPEGDHVSENDIYYVRLINSGDVVVVEEEAETPAPKKK